jgi:hypothetical protein
MARSSILGHLRKENLACFVPLAGLPCAVVVGSMRQPALPPKEVLNE